MSNHTSGPWKRDMVFGLIVGPKGEEIAAIHSGGSDGRQSAEVSNYNARLIAAAPDMLAALKSAVNYLDGFKGPFNHELLNLKDVIAKAEGR